MSITITLEHHEALMILDPIQDGALDDRIAAAKAKDPGTREWHDIRAAVRQRIATTIVDTLYPEEPEPDILVPHTSRFDWIGREEFEAEYEMGLL